MLSKDAVKILDVLAEYAYRMSRASMAENQTRWDSCRNVAADKALRIAQEAIIDGDSNTRNTIQALENATYMRLDAEYRKG